MNTMAFRAAGVGCGQCDHLPGFPAIPCRFHAGGRYYQWMAKRKELMDKHGYTEQQADNVQMGWDPDRKPPATYWRPRQADLTPGCT